MRFYPTKQDSAYDTPILFVHGAWHGAWCWEEHFVQEFNAAGYDCYTFNLPGHDHPGEVRGINRLSIADYVDALVKNVAAMPKAPIIVGHSMGGLVVQKYLEKHQCETVVLLSPAPPHGIIRTTLKFMTRSYAWWPLLTLNLYKMMNTVKKLRWACFTDQLSDKKIAKYSNKICSESFLAFLNMILPMVKINHHLEANMMVIAGNKDRIFSVGDNESTAKKYGAELIILNDMGHDLMLDKGWEDVAANMIEWLSRHQSLAQEVNIEKGLAA